VCDEKDPNLNKSDKLYKVRFITEHILQKFQHYYSPQQMMSIDEGMVPSKNRLSFKQYCKDKPTKWGIKTFTLTDSRNGYLYSTEVYVGNSDDSLQTLHPELGATGNVVRRSMNGLKTMVSCIVFILHLYCSNTLQVMEYTLVVLPWQTDVTFRSEL